MQQQKQHPFEPTLIGVGITGLVVAVLGTAVWRKRKEKKNTSESPSAIPRILRTYVSRYEEFTL